MENAKTWYLNIKKSGQPVFIINDNGFLPTKHIKPRDEDVQLDDDGIIVSGVDKDYFLSWSTLKYRTIYPQQLSELIEGEVEKASVLHFVYEFITGVIRSKAPLALPKTDNIRNLVAEYREFYPQFKHLDFEYIAMQIQG